MRHGLQRALHIGVVCLGVFWLGIASAFVPGVGDRVIVRQVLPLRDAPPSSGYLVTKGKAVGMLKPGEQAIIEDTRQVKSLFRNDTWIKIKRRRPTGGPAHGWVYFGENGRGTANFEKRN